MIYAFRIRPLVRLFLAAVMVWFASTCMNATRVVPTDKGTWYRLKVRPGRRSGPDPFEPRSLTAAVAVREAMRL